MLERLLKGVIPLGVALFLSLSFAQAPLECAQPTAMAQFLDYWINDNPIGLVPDGFGLGWECVLDEGTPEEATYIVSEGAAAWAFRNPTEPIPWTGTLFWGEAQGAACYTGYEADWALASHPYDGGLNYCTAFNPNLYTGPSGSNFNHKARAYWHDINAGTGTALCSEYAGEAAAAAAAAVTCASSYVENFQALMTPYQDALNAWNIDQGAMIRPFVMPSFQQAVTDGLTGVTYADPADPNNPTDPNDPATGGGYDDAPSDDNGCNVLNIPCNFKYFFIPQISWASEFSSLTNIGDDKFPFGLSAWFDTSCAGCGNTAWNNATSGTGYGYQNISFEIPYNLEGDTRTIGIGNFELFNNAATAPITNWWQAEPLGGRMLLFYFFVVMFWFGIARKVIA